MGVLLKVSPLRKPPGRARPRQPGVQHWKQGAEGSRGTHVCCWGAALGEPGPRCPGQTPPAPSSPPGAQGSAACRWSGARAAALAPPGASGDSSGPSCGKGDLEAELSGLRLRHDWTCYLRVPGGAGGTRAGLGEPRCAGGRGGGSVSACTCATVMHACASVCLRMLCMRVCACGA